MQIRSLNPGQVDVNVFIFPSNYAQEDLEIFLPYLNRLNLKAKLFDYVKVNNFIVGAYNNEIVNLTELPFDLFVGKNTLVMCSEDYNELELLALAEQLDDSFIFSVSSAQLERLYKLEEFIC